MLLAMGQTAFFGPASESLDYFAGLGHKPDGLVNPADYLLEVRLSGLPITVHVHILFKAFWKMMMNNRSLFGLMIRVSLSAVPELSATNVSGRALTHPSLAFAAKLV